MPVHQDARIDTTTYQINIRPMFHPCALTACGHTVALTDGAVARKAAAVLTPLEQEFVTAGRSIRPRRCGTPISTFNLGAHRIVNRAP